LEGENNKIKEDRTRLESIRAAHRDAGNSDDDDDAKVNKRSRQRHQRQRPPLQSDRMEDYLEVIYELIRLKGYATTTDTSNYLNVSLPSVTKMMQKLDEAGYLKYEKYRGIVLTKEGTDIAQNMRERHSLVVEFLEMLGIDDTTANIDAEGIEHHLHPETLRKLEEFVRATKN
jgi:Mn-dependent DtxR family transcriptional regulator